MPNPLDRFILFLPLSDVKKTRSFPRWVTTTMNVTHDNYGVNFSLSDFSGLLIVAEIWLPWALLFWAIHSHLGRKERLFLLECFYCEMSNKSSLCLLIFFAFKCKAVQFSGIFFLITLEEFLFEMWNEVLTPAKWSRSMISLWFVILSR